jgi:hypothetical protein
MQEYRLDCLRSHGRRTALHGSGKQPEFEVIGDSYIYVTAFSRPVAD